MIWDWIKQKFRYLLNSFKTTKIKASYDDDLFEILDQLDLKEQIENGDIRCGICDTIITTDNLSAITKREKNFLLICSNPSCLSTINQ